MTEPAIYVRPAEAADVESATDVWIRSRHASYPAIPRSVHDDDDMRRHFRETLMPRGGVWVAEADGAVVGVLALGDGWVDHLYIAPGWTGRGVGARLLDVAKERYDVLDLWAFQSNHGARRFYERHGFVEVARTDGDNEEKAPDVRYRWRRG